MKTSDFLLLAGEHRDMVQYSKDLPHYRLLQIIRIIGLIGFLSFAAGLFVNGVIRNTLFIVAATLILLTSIAYRVVVFIREEKLRHGG